MMKLRNPMKLSEKTVNLLKNFASINQSILFKQGKSLRTISVMKNILAEANIDEDIPQEFGVYPKVSAIDLLDHMAVMKGITDTQSRKEQVESLLYQVNLWDSKEQKLGTFSGGMKQRFGIAQALLGCLLYTSPSPRDGLLSRMTASA